MTACPFHIGDNGRYPILRRDGSIDYLSAKDDANDLNVTPPSPGLAQAGDLSALVSNPAIEAQRSGMAAKELLCPPGNVAAFHRRVTCQTGVPVL